MTNLAKMLILAIWLLGQTLTFAHSALPNIPGMVALTSATVEKSQTGNFEYDGDRNPGIVCDFVLPSTTTAIPGHSIEVNLATLAYGVDLVPIFLGKGDFLAAKGGELIPHGEPCFIAGTLVATQDGLKPIETIQTNDWVWSHDEHTRQTTLNRVAKTFIKGSVNSIVLFLIAFTPIQQMRQV